MSGATGPWLMIAAGVAVVATVVAAIVTMGTPGQQRLMRQDERRERDLASLKREVEGWAERNGALPTTLATLARPGVRLRTEDPFTTRPYEYQVLDARRYRLCATFETDTADMPDAEGGRGYGLDWRHPRGRQCFDLKLPGPAKAQP